MTVPKKSPKNTAKSQSNLASSDSLDNREKIGKGNPPKHSQFKPGISPNPSGRPRGVRNRSTVLKEFLEATLKTKNPITGLEETLTVEQRMALSMIAQVLTKGNVQAWNSIKDDVYGKITDKIESNLTITDLDVTPEQRREALSRILNAKHT